MRNTPPPQGTAVQTMQSSKGNMPTMQYSAHSPHSNTTPPIQHVRDNQNREIPSHIPQHNARHLPPTPSVNAQHVLTNHTPLQHSYNPPVQRQGPPSNGGSNNIKPQINGDSKLISQRNNRNNYSPQNNIPNQIQQNRHREEVKELQKFSQDFKLSSSQSEPLVIANQVPEPLPPPPMPNQPPPPPQPQQSISPPQENLDKVTNSIKKSTLNPNAKEFVLNPTAKPFTPSTPSASRPHTPQTPSHSPYMPVSGGGSTGQPPVPVVMGYMMQGQPPYPSQAHPQGNRIRKVPMGQIRADMASQMQVAAETGQPLLAPAPTIQQFVYPPGINPQSAILFEIMKAQHTVYGTTVPIIRLRGSIAWRGSTSRLAAMAINRNSNRVRRLAA
ncbi:hypothetical protein FQA39_LY13252 [Lamprigera yunnana]|nr:hypothetical protein FQA39_LY13252 [Lamprigera yunnana]